MPSSELDNLIRIYLEKLTDSPIQAKIAWHPSEENLSGC